MCGNRCPGGVEMHKDIITDFKEFAVALVGKTVPTTMNTSWYNALMDVYHGMEEEGLLISPQG